MVTYKRKFFNCDKHDVFMKWLMANVGPCTRVKFGVCQGEQWLMMISNSEIKVQIDDPALLIMFKLACL